MHKNILYNLNIKKTPRLKYKKINIFILN
jgi:hypothetical protein